MESTSYLRISNPLNYMNEHYIKQKVLVEKYSSGEVTVIYKNQYPVEILIKFPTDNLYEDFLKEFNASSFEEDFNYKLEITKVNINPKEEEEKVKLTEEKHNVLKYYLPYEKMVFDVSEYENTLYEPGLILRNEVEKKRIEKGVKWLLKRIGKNILQGQAILSISLPVFLFDKRPLHEVFAYQHKASPFYLTHAFYCTDKLEKMKWMIVYLMSQLYISTFQTKPFNPILGETFQCKIGDLNFYFEQTVNHPITYNFYAFDDAGLYKIHGFQETYASTGANTVNASQTGKYYITFKDGTEYKIHWPGVLVRGITMGKRTYNYCDKAVIEDLTNKITAFMQMNPDEVGYMKSWITSKQTTPPDTFRGDIVKSEFVTISKKDQKHTIANNASSWIEIKGEWTNDVCFDNDEYWKVEDYQLWAICQDGFVLPSDGRLRTDYIEWVKGDETKSQEEKEKLEVLQRTDRKWRAKYGKK